MSQIGLDFNRAKSESEVLALEPFNSTKKKAGVATKSSENHEVVHWKGAAEMILAACTHVADGNGNVEEMSGTGVRRRSESGLCSIWFFSSSVEPLGLQPF